MTGKDNTESIFLKMSLFALHPKGERLVLIEISITGVILGVNYIALVQNYEKLTSYYTPYSTDIL